MSVHGNCSKTKKSPLILTSLSLAITLALASGHAAAGTYTVTNTNTSGAGSLEQAIINANLDPGSTIDFGAITAITTGSSLTTLTQDTTFTSANAVTLTGLLDVDAELSFAGGGSFSFDGTDGADGLDVYTMGSNNIDGGAGGAGGDSVSGTGFTLTNSSTFTGGVGGDGGYAVGDPNYGAGGAGGTGGAAVSGSYFTLTNTGSIIGGAGGEGEYSYSMGTNNGAGGAGGAGGAAVSGSYFTLTNTGSIIGGAGGKGEHSNSMGTNNGAGGDGGVGGAAISGSAYTLNLNSGSNVTGGDGGDGDYSLAGSTNNGTGGNGGDAGIGIKSTGNSTINIDSSTVSAGSAGSGGTGNINGVAGQAAAAISFSGGGNTLVLTSSDIYGDVMSASGSGDTISTVASSSILSLGDVSGFSTFRTSVTNDTTYAQLSIAGTLTLQSTTNIVVDVTNPNFAFTTAVTNGLSDIITAGTIAGGNTFNVTDNSLLFDFDAALDGNTIDLSLAAATPKVGASTQSQGKSAATGAAKVLDSVIAASPSSELAANFVSLSTEKQVADAVESTLPSVSGEVASITSLTTSPVVKQVHARQLAVSGLSSGDAVFENRHAWFKPFGSWTEQDERQGVTGYDIDSYGAVFGIDGDITPDWNVGAAFSYVTSDVDSQLSSGSNKTDIDSYIATVYASTQLDERTLWSLQAGAGLNKYDSKRRLFTNDVAKGDYDGWQLLISSELARSFDLSEKATVTPYVNASYSYVDVDGYRESGAGALNLDVDGDDADSLVLSVGAKGEYLASSNLSLLAELGVGYDVMAERSRLTSAYSGGGAQFTTEGMKPDEFVYNAALGAQYKLDNGTSISARYDFNGREDYTDETVSVNVRWLF